MRICAHLDASAGPPLLLPPNDAQVRRQVDIVDRLPHPAILYGFHPDDDQRPDFIKGVMRDVHQLKCESLQKFIDDNRDEETLVAAYRSKIAKEQAGKALAFDHERQRRIRATYQDLIEDLDQQLGASADPWLCGATFSMADVVWAISENHAVARPGRPVGGQAAHQGLRRAGLPTPLDPQPGNRLPLAHAALTTYPRCIKDNGDIPR